MAGPTRTPRRGAEGLEEERAGDGTRHLRGARLGHSGRKGRGRRGRLGRSSCCISTRLLRTRREASELEVEKKERGNFHK